MNFKYIDRHGGSYQYRGLTPMGFFECLNSPSCPSGQFLSAYHAASGKTKEFCVDRITEVVESMNIIEAMVDPSKGSDFWNGSFTLSEKTPL